MSEGDLAAHAYPRLLEPLGLGPVTAPNRIVFGANFTMFTDPAPVFGEPGFYGEHYGDYLEERARGGAGTIVAGQAHVHPTSAYQMPNNAAAWDERCVPGLARIAERLHAHGAVAVLQLAHNGGATGTGASGLTAVSPSGVANHGQASKALERHEIHELVESFAVSAANAAAAGFDGVELHAAHGYLIHEFLTPLFNRREDEYGGSFDGRVRFLVEVLAAVRQAVGPSIAVGIRLTGGDERPEAGSLTAEDGAEIAVRLEDEGLVDFLDVSPGVSGSGLVRPLYAEHGCVVDAAATVKHAVRGTPVFAVHRIVTPEEAEAVLARGDADAVTLVRALIADPDWPRKAREGRAGEIRPCTGCNQACYGNLFRGLAVRCVTNPSVGREAVLAGEPAAVAPADRRRVVVVGGGPGGLEAAWVAASRGHDVVLLERADEFGGAVRLARRLPGRGELGGFVDWRVDECRRRGVDLRAGVDATRDVVHSLSPDVVVVATGGTATVDRPAKAHAFPLDADDDAHVVDHVLALRGPTCVGQRVVVLDAVGFVEGIAVAEHLARQEREVVLVTPLPNATLLDSETHTAALRRAVRAGVDWRPNTSVSAVRGREVHVVDRWRGPEVLAPVESVVVRTHGVPVDELYFDLLETVPDVRRIGDAVAVRTAQEAIYEGHMAGRAV